MTDPLSNINIPGLIAVLVAPYATYLFMKIVAHPLAEQIGGKEYPEPRLTPYLIAFVFILIGTVLLLFGY